MFSEISETSTLIHVFSRVFRKIELLRINHFSALLVLCFWFAVSLVFQSHNAVFFFFNLNQEGYGVSLISLAR